jgi:hypothetical protein
MKIIIRIIIISIYVLSFFSCCKEKKVPYNGHLKGEIKYTGASNMEVDNVIITLIGTTDKADAVDKRITKDGKYDLELPAGNYVMTLKGNRCKSDELPYEVKINANETRTKDINIEQLPSSMVILYNETEYKSGDTIVLGAGVALDIWNKYSNNTLQWDIRAYPQPSWIIFEETKGEVTGGGRKSVVFSIDKNKISNDGDNYSDVILTTEDNGSFTVTVKSFKEGEKPGETIITGDKENTCPAKSVKLIADAAGATSYEWYKDNTTNPIRNANREQYEVTQNGIYYAVGVNENGKSKSLSKGKSVTIKTCPNLPGKATISASHLMRQMIAKQVDKW